VVSVDGFVLAGGHSSRMGFDKARAPWGRVPMAVAVLQRVRAVCERAVLVRRGPADGLPWIDADGGTVEVLWEADPGSRHPLWGVHAALCAARGPLALVVPCDVPGVSADTLRALIEAGAVAVAEGRRHPLVAALPTALADRAAELARAGAPAHALVADLPGVEVPSEELRNLNRPEALPDPMPVAALVSGCPVGPGAQQVRIALGEARRLARRGILDPRAGRDVSSWAAQVGEAE
jgi:molybdopterin-guanine dinucleotide biosynthesis protein A